jgi:hypothetical protein
MAPNRKAPRTEPISVAPKLPLSSEDMATDGVGLWGSHCYATVYMLHDADWHWIGTWIPRRTASGRKNTTTICHIIKINDLTRRLAQSADVQL